MSLHPIRVRCADSGIDLVTIPNVELLEVGMDWRTSTGIFTFTEEDLQSAVEAAEDPAIRTAVIKFGHTDPRFDGDFSIGRIDNLTITNNGQTLCGDYVGVPRWLAEIMPAAYPRRSIEGEWDVESYTGNRWPFKLTAVALLGARYPAISTIEDIREFWNGEPEKIEAMMVEGESDDPSVSVTSHGIMFRAQPVEASEVPIFNRGGKTKASVEVEDVRRQFYDQLEIHQSWWWIRAIQIDPPQLIVDDDEGSLYRVGYSISGDEVSFDDPIRVKVEYKDVAAKVAASFEQWGTDPAVTVYPTRDASVGATITPRASSTPSEEPMNEAQKALIGLPADATDEQVTAKLTELAATTATGGGDGGEGGDGGGTATPANPGVTPPAGNPEDPATKPDGGETTDGTPKVPDGMVLVDAATLAELKTGLQQVQARTAAEETGRRKAVVDAALKDGKIPRARREHYDTLMASTDPEVVKQTEAILASMPSGLIPVDREHGEGDGDLGADGNAAEAYPAGWLPEVQARAGAERPVIVTEV